VVLPDVPGVPDVPDVPDTPATDVAVTTDSIEADGYQTDTTLDAESICFVGEKRCLTDTIVQTCLPSGAGWDETTCPGEERCYEGTCGPVTCEPNTPSPQCPSPTETAKCNSVGTGFVITKCEDGNTCFEGQCVDYICPPGTVTCWSMHAVQMCNDDGSGWEIIEVCDPGGQCDHGVCLDPCAVAEQTQRTLGCTFVVTPMDTGHVESIHNGLAITLPLSSNPAECSIQNTESGELVGDTLLIEPGETVTLPLPPAPAQLGSNKSTVRYRLVSTMPVAVQQLVPWPTEESPIHDAAVVFPSSSDGTEFIVSGWPTTRKEDKTYVGWVNVVATAAEPTTVRVVPRTELSAGPAGSGLVASKPNQPFSFTLQPNEVAHLEPIAEQGSDLTGTHILSDQPVAVFAGHECVRIPETVNGCHSAVEQLPPLSMWGTQVVAVPFAPRSDTQVDLWRIIAGAENVQIETHPPQPGYAYLTLPKGGSITLSASSPFAVSASGPILVTQWMTGAAYPGHGPPCEGVGLGGPSMVIVPPVEQFARKGALMKAIQLDTNLLNLVIPKDTKVWIDDTLLIMDENTPTLDEWFIVQHPLSLGAHTVEASRRIGMTAYAYGCDASFAYPAGQRLKTVYEETPCTVSSPQSNGTGPEEPPTETPCSLLYPDIDGDGAGATGFGACLCAPEGAYQVLFGGDCDDYNPLVNGWVPEQCNGLDDNCNNTIDEGCDDDNDGWCDDDLVVVGLPEICPNGGGDCMDYSALVSPEHVEILGNGFDDNCDGLIDDQLPINAIADCTNLPCVGHTLQAALCSLEICFGPANVGGVTITSPTESDIDNMWEAVAHFGAADNDLAPRAGSSYLILSTGQATGTDHNQAMGGTTLPDPYPKFTHQTVDAAQLQLTLTAPDGATGFSIDTVFLSAEFEESVGSASSDKFYMLLKAPETTNDETIVINHTPCLKDSWDFDLPTETGFDCFMSVNTVFGESCTGPTTDLTGTGYECNLSSPAGGSSTGWLQTRWPIQQGETFSLTLLIHDTADGQHDSSVIIDNFHWESGGTNAEVVKIGSESKEEVP